MVEANYPKGNVRVLILIVVLLFAFAFLLNFFWEALHAVYLYQRHDLDASNYVPMLIYVSTMDGLLILGLYLGVGLVWRDLFWVRIFSRKQILVYFVAGVVTASAIEYRAVFLQQRWLYKEAMPTVLGIGLSPLVQLSLTGLATLWLTRELLYGEGLFCRNG